MKDQNIKFQWLYSAVKKGSPSFCFASIASRAFQQSCTVTNYTWIESLISDLSNELSFTFMNGHYGSADRAKEKSELLKILFFRLQTLKL